MEKNNHNDKLFKGILENHPEFIPSKSDIDDIRNRLDDVQPKEKKKGFGSWWLLFLLIPFTSGILFLFYQNNLLHSKINDLNSQISSIQTVNSHQKNTTYHFDTIYRTTYVDKIIERKSYTNSLKQNSQNESSALNYLNNNAKYFVLNSPFSKNNNFNSFPNSKNNYSNLSGIFLDDFHQFNFQKKNNREINEGLKKEIFISEVSSIPSLLSFLDEKDIELSENIYATFEHKKRKRNPLHYLSPKGFRIGISGSPIGLSALSGTFSKPIFSYGISNEIEFNDNFRMMLGLRNSYQKFETKDPATMALFPMEQPEDPTDNIRELYVTLKNLQVPISFKYVFSKEKKLRPFVSSGFVASRPYQQKFKYKFIKNNLEEYESIKTFNDGIFSIKNFNGSLGLEYSFTNNLFGDASIFYMHDFELNPGEYYLIQNLGLNMSLNMSLKYKL